MFISLQEADHNKEIVINTDKIVTIQEVNKGTYGYTGLSTIFTEIKLQGMKYPILVTNTMDELSQRIK